MGDWLNQGWWGEHITADTVVRPAPDLSCPSCQAVGSTWVLEKPGARVWVCGECQHGHAEDTCRIASEC